MKGNIVILITGILAISAVLSGCAKNKIDNTDTSKKVISKSKFEPFKDNPENEIEIDSMKEIVNNEKERTGLYKLEFNYVTNKKTSEEVQKELDALKKKDSKVYKFDDKELNTNTLKLYVLYDINDLQKTYTFDKLAKAVVQDYLDISKVNKPLGNGLKLWLSPEMEKNQPVEKVQEYMKNNDIKITDIEFPNTYESKNTMMYPVRYTFSYIVKGTIKGQPFEKQITQDFYFGLDMQDLNNWKKDFKMPIQYIRDISNDNLYRNSYMTMNRIDRSIGDLKRIELNIYINDEETTVEKLETYANKIIKDNSEYSGFLISFYDLPNESYSTGYTPVGVAMYAPSGDFIHSYSKEYNENKSILKVGMNEVRYQPTKEEKELYNNYLSRLKITPKMALEDIAKQLGKNAQDLMNLDIKMQTRYKEVLK